MPTGFGTVVANRISATELDVTVTLQGGEPNQTFSIEIFEAGPCIGDNATDTGVCLNSNIEPLQPS
jgi:hypothetical protein